MQAASNLDLANNRFIVDSPIGVDAAATAPAINHASDQTISGSSAGDWYTLIRDITAVANSGGGQISLPSPIDEQELRRQLSIHTHDAFVDIAVHPVAEHGTTTHVITVGPALFPISVSEVADNRGSAVSGTSRVEAPGSFYFRHGERSEPATRADMRDFIERLVQRVQRRWLQRLRRVMNRPVASLFAKSPRKWARTARAAENLQPVRIVTDPNAPALQPQDVDRLYPWRQKDLLRELNARLGRRMLNSYDIQAVRRQNKLDDRPDFVFNLPGAGRRYSPATAEWIMVEYARDPEFFRRARAADHELMKLRRQKPR